MFTYDTKIQGKLSREERGLKTWIRKRERKGESIGKNMDADIIHLGEKVL